MHLFRLITLCCTLLHDLESFVFAYIFPIQAFYVYLTLCENGVIDFIRFSIQKASLPMQEADL